MDTKSPAIVSSQLLRPAREVDPVKEGCSFTAPACKDDEAFAAAVKLLKESLAEALVAFYQLAGRMRAGDGAADPVLELDCTDLSVRLSEATTEAVLDELGDFEPSEFCDSLCDMGCSPTYPWDPQVPLLFVQVTRFACGGISVGIACSHQTCDGVSAWHFMSSWAEIARTGELHLLPEVTYAYTDEKRKEPVPQRPKSDKLSEKLSVKRYNLDKGMIEKLKSEAAAGSTGFKKFSTFEVVCAHFWKKVVIARGQPESDYSHFIVLSNCRGKIKSLSKSYFGNAISPLMVTAIVGELTSSGISYAANILHEAIVGYDEDKAIARFASDPRFMMVVSSPRHPVYECDFGFGRPIGVTFGTNDLGDGKLYLFPSAQGEGQGGGVDATVVLRPEALERLQQDPPVLP